MSDNLHSLTPKKRRSGQRMTPTERKATQAAFLATFEQSANVTQACRAANISREMIYTWLEHDAEFSILYHQAEQIANDAIRAEIHRRGGPTGYDEQVIVGGKVQTVHKYSDVLLIFLAKSRMPEFREKQQVEVTTNPDVSGFKELLMQRLARLEGSSE